MSQPGLPLLQTERLVVRLGTPEDAAAIARYFDENRAHLAPWDPIRPEAFYTAGFWERRVVESVADFEAESAVRFFVFQRSDDAGEVLGTANLSNIVRSAFQACHLGYGIAAKAQGQGLMFEALEAVCRYALVELGLHRVMANYMPRNERSGRLLRRLGFRVEGYAYDYLQIAGNWEDHVLTSLVRR